MKSMYFDDSLYENELHYRLAEMLKDFPLDDDCEEIVIDCDNEEQYNNVLDALFHAADGKFKISAVSNNPMEIIIEKDPRDNYRKFDESALMEKKEE